jgi:cation:H+ antiporter
MAFSFCVDLIDRASRINSVGISASPLLSFAVAARWWRQGRGNVLLVWFVVGLLCLFVGGELLVRGAVAAARRFGVPPLVIGLTIVGFGTSTPELLVALQAALGGAPDIAVGNVVGSNISNVLLILGLTAIAGAVPMAWPNLRNDMAAMLGATAVLWLVLLGDSVRRLEGLFLVACLAAYLWATVRRSAPAPTHAAGERPALAPALLAMGGGLAGLLFGADRLVFSATEIARAFGLSEAVIGLTIVAVGTSLPELATSLIAAIRGNPAIAVGNVIGSNIFNILGILGLTAVVRPIPVDPRFAGIDMAMAMGAALVVVALSFLHDRISRRAGAAFLAAYAAYTVLLAL